MPDYTKCSQCGIALPVDPPDQPREPCPSCGSTTRTFHQTITGNLKADISIRLTAVGTLTDASALPALLLGGIVVRGKRTDEGVIIEATAPAWARIVAEIQRDPSIAYRLTATQWEEMVAGAYERAGANVILTPRSGDRGRDVIATFDAIGTIRIIDQVKAYKPGHLVDANDVRALMGVLPNDTASKGFLSTTSDFAPLLKDDPLIKPYIPARLELVNGQQLFKRLAELAKK